MTVRWRTGLIEVLAIVFVFYLAAGFPPPDVNEPNYLGKARHFWDPAWCAGDLYLESADAHLAFYALFGWVTLRADLETAAWIGRIATWTMLAAGWVALARACRLPVGASVLAAALFQTGNHFGHLSGEWVVGGCEAKGFAHAAVLFALADYVRGKPRAVVLWLATATCLHVLVGGWAAVAMGLAWLGQRALLLAPRLSPEKRVDARTLLVAAALVTVGLWPVATMNAGTSEDVVRGATRIYVYERLPHHLLPAGFPHRYDWHATLLGAWAVAAWFTRRMPALRMLNAVALAAVGISAAGIVLDTVTAHWPDMRAELMRFYWFRAADALVPAAGAMSWVALAASLRAEHCAAAMTGLAVVAAVLLGDETQHQLTLRWPRASEAYDPAHWRDACRWVRDHTPPETLFITPRDSQTFKWYAARGEVVNWKELPQDAASIVEWRARAQAIHGTPATEADLERLAKRYGASYLVAAAEPRLALPCEYRNNSYAVYRVGP